MGGGATTAAAAADRVLPGREGVGSSAESVQGAGEEEEEEVVVEDVAVAEGAGGRAGREEWVCGWVL